MVIGFRGAILMPQSNGKNKLKSGLCDPVHHGNSVVDISQSVTPDTRLSARAACIASSHLTSQRLGGGIEQNYRVEPSQGDRGLSGACNRIRRRVPQRSGPTTGVVTPTKFSKSYRREQHRAPTPVARQASQRKHPNAAALLSPGTVVEGQR